ncbi:MAG: ATPase, T2SS/T4P/T4SS family [Kluyvera sp.]
MQAVIYRLQVAHNVQVKGIAQVSEINYYLIVEQLLSKENKLLEQESSNTQLALEEMLKKAVALRASDLHITRNDMVANIELRINGVLCPFLQMKASRCDELVFVLYNVEASTRDTTWNRNIAQNANIFYSLEGKSYRFRYAHYPIFGETSDCYHVVLRIIPSGLDKASVASLDKLGVSDAEISDLKKILSNPYGAYIIAGTTGSGKSTTLKNLMEWMQINRYDNRGCFLTVEDPVEYQIYGATQSSVLSGESGGFHSAIKSSLRRDPDVLMVGEIRDNISSNALAGAVESGHYCFTTVHAGNIVSLLQRLSALGITSDKLSTPGFIAGLQCQKLIPVLCSECKISLGPTAIKGREFQLYEKNPQGCPACKRTGIGGRQLVMEYLLPVYDELEAIAEQKWLKVYTIWREKRLKQTSLSEGFEIKEKTMAAVLQGRVCATWFQMEFGHVVQEELEVIVEKIR